MANAFGEFVSGVKQGLDTVGAAAPVVRDLLVDTANDAVTTAMMYGSPTVNKLAERNAGKIIPALGQYLEERNPANRSLKENALSLGNTALTAASIPAGGWAGNVVKGAMAGTRVIKTANTIRHGVKGLTKVKAGRNLVGASKFLDKANDFNSKLWSYVPKVAERAGEKHARRAAMNEAVRGVVSKTLTPTRKELKAMQELKNPKFLEQAMLTPGDVLAVGRAVKGLARPGAITGGRVAIPIYRNKKKKK